MAATATRMSVIISNPIRYTVPSDSEDSDIEEDSQPKFLQQNPNYVKQPAVQFLGEPGDVLQSLKYKLMNESKKCAHQDRPSSKHQQEHKDKIEAIKQKILDLQKQRTEESLAKIRSSLSQLELKYNGEEKDLDAEYSKYLEESRKRVQKAISIDKEKMEKEKAQKEAEVKAQKAKEQKELEDKQKVEKAAKEKKDLEEKARLQEQSTSASISGLKLHEEYMKKLEYYKQHYKPKLQDPKFRSTVFKERMPIKRFLKQLQFKREVVDQRFVAIRDRILAVKQQSEEAYHILLNCTAKDFLKQARSEISSISWGAYFYGRFAMMLGSAIPEFMEYLLARLYKRCPYMIPNYHDESGLSLDEIKKRQRYEFVDDEKKDFQTVDMHYNYQYAYIMFFAALVQMTPQLPSDPQNPHGIQYGWLWLARICNIPPRPITPGLVYSFLQIAGRPLLQSYPRQALKVFQLIRNDMLPVTPKSRENASPLNELARFLDDFFRTGEMSKMPEKAEAKA